MDFIEELGHYRPSCFCQGRRMSDLDEVRSLWIHSPTGSTYCICEERDASSVCECDSNSEEIIKIELHQSASQSSTEGSLKMKDVEGDGGEYSSEDSITSITGDTTPSELNIVCSISTVRGGYFVPDMYTKAKVCTFKRPKENVVKIEASSAINRRRKQTEIERQNLILLKKLRDVKPVVGRLR